jgi:hypothetical protein
LACTVAIGTTLGMLGCGVAEPNTIASGLDAASGGTATDAGIRGDENAIADADGKQADGRIVVQRVGTLDGPTLRLEAGEASDPEAGTDSTVGGDTGADSAGDAEAGSDEGGAEAGGVDGSMAHVCGIADCAPGAPCADLVPDPYGLMSSVVFETRTFDSTSCAIVEGCITSPGTRKLLRFETGIVNLGNADLVVGNTTNNVCFTYSQCHMHFHFKGAAQYTLYQADGTTVAAAGHKQGFCIDDTVAYQELQPVAPTPAQRFDCTYQGLHVGWEDIYPNDIDCQWIDVTGLPSGQYVLSIQINIGHYLPESNFDNNETHIPVTIP